MTVQLTDTLEGVREPVLGGELVKQERFLIVNKRPITITLMPRSNGWSVRNNRKEQVSYKTLKCKWYRNIASVKGY